MDFNQWLEREELSILAEVFAANHIDEVEILADLNDAELEAIGIPIGSRKKIQRALVGQGFRSDEPQASASQAGAPESTPPPIQDQFPPGSLTQDQQAAVPAEAEQQAEPQPASEAAMEQALTTPSNLAPPTSSPQAPAVQATRHQPKAKNSRRATAILIAVGVHVALILIATTLTIFAASKDEPEIIASIAPPSTTPQQEMKKKTVQKQVKQTPSAASAAAAPMAQMMKANAEARFTTPEVTRTSTGPLGVGEGDLGTGAFGVGSGLGDAGSGSFFGTPTSGNLAVIFDVSGSMKEASDRVVSEINRTFKTAHVVCVFGAKFLDKPAKMVSYRSNKNIQESLLKQRNQSMNQNMLSLKNCDSLAMKKPYDGKVYADLSSPKDKKKYHEASLESLGTAMETLLNQGRPPGTIFVFSDFMDGVDPKYMEKVANLAKQKRVKIVIWFPFSEDRAFRDRRHYETFVKMVGGELKIEKL